MISRRGFLHSSALVGGVSMSPAILDVIDTLSSAPPAPGGTPSPPPGGNPGGTPGGTPGGGTRPSNPEHVGRTLLDYSAGIPSGASIIAAGHVGVIRYVSNRRPGAEWMLAKPLRSPEVADMKANGVSIVSCYQFGKNETADWLGGYDAGVYHANIGLEIHLAAGGPRTAPIYAAIDDNPTTEAQYQNIFNYIRGWESVIGKANTGVYANYATTDRLVNEGVGSWFWQHSWNSPLPRDILHPAAHLHQYGYSSVGGIEVDLNRCEKAQYGQWY